MNIGNPTRVRDIGSHEAEKRSAQVDKNGISPKDVHGLCDVEPEPSGMFIMTHVPWSAILLASPSCGRGPLAFSKKDSPTPRGHPTPAPLPGARLRGPGQAALRVRLGAHRRHGRQPALGAGC